MPQNSVPHNLQGGPSFTASDTGSQGMKSQRSRPADIEEIMHLVRTQGLARETTEMRLHTHKAPLPGIGHSQPPVKSSNRTSRKSNHNSNSVDTDGTDDAYEFDSTDIDLNDNLQSRIFANNNNNPMATPTSPNTLNHSLSRSIEAMQYSNHPVNMNIGRVPLKPLKPGGRGLDPSPTRNPRAIRTLPPMILHERPLGAHGVRERPNAPSPSETISDSMDEETDDFIEM